MFDKNTLKELTESILYVNLLLAILALIALYDQRRVNDEDDEVQKTWEENVDSKLEELNERLTKLENEIKKILKIN